MALSYRICNFEGCKHLPPLGQLQHLEKLIIKGMNTIEVIGREFSGSNGGAAFPSLKSIEFKGMPKWKERLLKAVAFPSLTALEIIRCHELASLPHLPSLTRLKISCCDKLTSLPPLPSLQHLHIKMCPLLTSLSCLPSLQHLHIGMCPLLSSISCLPSLQELKVLYSMKLLKSEGSLRGIGGNRSLKTLQISGNLLSREDKGVMEGLQDLSSVEELVIVDFDDLDSLMDSMRHLLCTVLRLDIWNCKELGCMPEYMGSLTSLQSLTITGCPHLERRCEREKGEDWHLISHIPNINIYREEGTDNRQSKKRAISVLKERLSACIPSTSST